MNNKNPDKILRSGDLEQIVALDEETILENFGEDSFEYLAYQHKLAEQIGSNYLKIPRRTENPSATYGMLKGWIKEFCQQNDKLLPKGFHKKNKQQLTGLYHGMLDHYGIKPSDIVPQYDYRKILPLPRW